VGSPLVLGALATVSLHILGLAILGTRPPGPAFSQVLQTVCALLAGLACLQAGSRSAAFARTFWRLTAAGFLLWTLAQALGTYHLYFAPGPAQTSGLGVILYFFSFTPMFGALLISPGAGDPDRRWLLGCNRGREHANMASIAHGRVGVSVQARRASRTG